MPLKELLNSALEASSPQPVSECGPMTTTESHAGQPSKQHTNGPPLASTRGQFFLKWIYDYKANIGTTIQITSKRLNLLYILTILHYTTITAAKLQPTVVLSLWLRKSTRDVELCVQYIEASASYTRLMTVLERNNACTTERPSYALFHTILMT